MSIKYKLALPTFAGLIIILLLIEYFWLPYQLGKAKNTFEKQTHELLVLGTAGIILDLLENDFGSLFSNIEQLEKYYKGRWYNFTLYDENKKKIYPIFNNTSEVADQAADFLHIKYPLIVGETRLGYIALDIDWEHERIEIIDDIRNLRNIIVLVIILIIMVATISQYEIIYRPLKKLTVAANKIKKGRFNTSLTSFKDDEIGDLAKSFTEMQMELLFQKVALDEHAIVSVADKDGVIQHVNKKFVSISGYTRDELIGKTHRVVKSNIHSPEFYKQLWETIVSGKVWHGEICNMKKTGEKYWVSSTIIPDLDDQGAPKRYLSIRTEITEQKNAEEQLRHMANHDALTGLPTRRLCKENLSMALSLARREQKMVAVMFIDLDGFKSVNDEQGHDSGDLLLVGVSERLVRCVREMDTVARVGGDEFIVILSRIDNSENAGLVAQKIIDTLAIPFNINDKTASIGASIGIALYPHHENTPEELIKCADEMMYAAKRKGNNNYIFYDDV